MMECQAGCSVSSSSAASDVYKGQDSGHVANTNQDCVGVCFGEAFLDDCGVCSEGT